MKLNGVGGPAFYGLGERFGQCRVYNRNLFVFAGEKVNVAKLELSEPVRSLFEAIEVTLKLIEDNRIATRFFTRIRDRKEEESFRITLPLFSSGKLFEHHVTHMPVFLWCISEVDQYNDQYTILVLNCDESFAIKYPIEKIVVGEYGTIVKRASMKIKTEKRLLGELEKILHNV